VFCRQFPCLASATVDDEYKDTLLQISGHILQGVLQSQLESFNTLATLPKSRRTSFRQPAVLFE